MIDGGRCISPEEQYLQTLGDYAKSVGCDVKYYDTFNAEGEGYDSVYSFNGYNCVPPDFCCLTIWYFGDLLAQVKFDGRDRCEQYASILNRQSFKLWLHFYEQPYSKLEKFWWKLKRFIHKKVDIPYHYHPSVHFDMIPEFYNYKEDDIKYFKNRGFIFTEDFKKYLYYMKYENQMARKQRRVENKINELEEDFK